MTKDPRGGQFEYFRTMTDPWAGITVPVDITDLLASLNGRPFFLSYLYAVMRAANAVPELRRRLLPDGQVVEYDHCDPSYTVMKPDGTGVYVYCLLEDDLSSYEKFVAEGKRRQKETLERGTLTEDGDVLANFFVSCVPWLYYTQIKEARRRRRRQQSALRLGKIPRGKRPHDAADVTFHQPRALRRMARHAVL